MSADVLSLHRPSNKAEIISDRYLCKLRVRISCTKVLREVDVMPVRSLLMNAVFFLRAESSELLTGRTSEAPQVSVYL